MNTDQILTLKFLGQKLADEANAAYWDYPRRGFHIQRMEETRRKIEQIKGEIE